MPLIESPATKLQNWVCVGDFLITDQTKKTLFCYQHRSWSFFFVTVALWNFYLFEFYTRGGGCGKTSKAAWDWLLKERSLWVPSHASFWVNFLRKPSTVALEAAKKTEIAIERWIAAISIFPHLPRSKKKLPQPPLQSKNEMLDSDEIRSRDRTPRPDNKILTDCDQSLLLCRTILTKWKTMEAWRRSARRRSSCGTGRWHPRVDGAIWWASEWRWVL